MAESIGLVLAGGGARGAYEAGVLATLLPWLEQEHGQRPDVAVGTSVGALNAAYIGANAQQGVAELANRGAAIWRQIRYRDVLEPLLSLDELVLLSRVALNVALRGVAPYSLLDPGPLAKTLKRLIEFDQIPKNISAGALRACAVVATAAHSNRTVVFHDGGPNPPADERRGIDYVRTQLSESQVRASAAIPALFPAVHVNEPEAASGWFFDGGTRLNTPIKPALKFGAKRLIVIGLNSVAPAPSSKQRPDLFDGASQIVQGLLVDPVVNDIQTLATINETLIKGGAAGGQDQREIIPYIYISPRSPNQIGKIAAEVYRKYYSGVSGLARSRDLALLGRLVGALRNSTRGELFSYLFFAPEFAARLIELGQDDANRWISQKHDDGAWQRGALPQPKPAP